MTDSAQVRLFKEVRKATGGFRDSCSAPSCRQGVWAGGGSLQVLLEVGQVGSASGACVCCGPRSEMTLSQVLYTYLSLLLTTLQGKFRLFPVYRWGNRSSEKVSHLPEATHHVSSLQLPDRFTPSLWLFHWQLLPYWIQVSAQMSLERLILTTLKYQRSLFSPILLYFSS